MVCSWINNPSSDKSWRCSLPLLSSESSECMKKLAKSISNMPQQNNLARAYCLNLERSLWWSWNFSSSDHKPCNPVYEFWSASENARRGQNAFLGFKETQPTSKQMGLRYMTKIVVIQSEDESNSSNGRAQGMEGALEYQAQLIDQYGTKKENKRRKKEKIQRE